MDSFRSRTGVCGRFAPIQACSRISLLGVLLLAVSLSLAFDISSGRAQDPTPTATVTPSAMIPITEMMLPPPLPEHPTQADLGRQRYYYVCMACHGDLGQGLTPEWVEQWGLERNTCWQSKCHAANHPPEGFVLPRTIPGVVGGVLTGRFDTALELHDYLRAAMPWHAPGSLQEDEYWQLTAFLLQLNGIGPLPHVLDATSAVLVAWGAPAPTPTAGYHAPFTNPKAVWVGAGVVLGVLVMAVIITLLAVRGR